MIKVENIEVSGFGAAFRGLRNPKNSWHLSDSYFGLVNTEYSEKDWEVTDKWVKQEKPDVEEYSVEYEKLFSLYNKWLLEEGILRQELQGGVADCAFIGPKDLDLAQRMVKAGDDEAKFTRMIHCQMDITAGHTWWAEFDTYKVATTRNSCSKMHKIHVKEFIKDDFDHEGIDEVGGKFKKHFEETLKVLEELRILFNETQEKRYWRAIIELLPMGYHLRATVDLSYQTLRHMYFARKNHKMDEWKLFCKIIQTLPYGVELICVEKEKK